MIEIEHMGDHYKCSGELALLKHSIEVMYNDIRLLAKSPGEPIPMVRGKLQSYEDIKNDIAWMEDGSDYDKPWESLRGACVEIDHSYDTDMRKIATELAIVKERVAITEELGRKKHEEEVYEDCQAALVKYAKKKSRKSIKALMKRAAEKRGDG